MSQTLGVKGERCGSRDYIWKNDPLLYRFIAHRFIVAIGIKLEEALPPSLFYSEEQVYRAYHRIVAMHTRARSTY